MGASKNNNSLFSDIYFVVAGHGITMTLLFMGVNVRILTRDYMTSPTLRCIQGKGERDGEALGGG